MIFRIYELEGRCRADLDTEIRYYAASAKVDGIELMELSVLKGESDKDNTRILNCINQILSALKREQAIQFYALPESFERNTTEAAFLLNKYAEYISSTNDGLIKVYAKIQ